MLASHFLIAGPKAVKHCRRFGDERRRRRHDTKLDPGDGATVVLVWQPDGGVQGVRGTVQRFSEDVLVRDA